MDDDLWELDGITFNDPDPDVDGVEWRIESVRGWSGGSQPRTARAPRVGGHGSYRGPVYRSERIVELVGWAWAPDASARRRAEHRLAALCADPGMLYRLQCTEVTGVLTADVELDQQIDPVISGENWLDYVIQVAAPDPRKHGPWAAASETGLPVDPPGGLDASAPGLDASAPGLDAGTPGSSGFVSVTNVGTAPAYPLVRFLGPLDTPQLADITTGDILRYTGVLGDTDRVVINADDHPITDGPLGTNPARSVVLNEVADRGGLLAIIGDWPVVQPGETATWAFSANNTSTTARAEVYLRPAMR